MAKASVFVPATGGRVHDNATAGEIPAVMRKRLKCQTARLPTRIMQAYDSKIGEHYTVERHRVIRAD